MFICNISQLCHNTRITNIDAIASLTPHLVSTENYFDGNSISRGKQNYFYTYRIRAAAKLWKAKKIDAIVVSGDKSKYHDEVTAMYKDLIKAGVPARYITKDYFGFRTFDSIVRAKEIFGLDDYIIVSQKFHLKRALYIAKEKDKKLLVLQQKIFREQKLQKRWKIENL